LGNGLKLDDTFAMIRDVRTRCSLPILTMVSFSIVTRRGAEEYFARAAEAGVDGVIIPDLPIDEGRAVAKLAQAKGLHPVFLVAPTTPEERMKSIVSQSRGFIYYIAVTGTTGARAELPPDLADHISKVQAATTKPVAVGFGVSRPEQVAAVARIADGVIVGSAIVKKVAEVAGKPRAELVASVGEFLAALAAAKSKPRA
jgi:tryptophan synthase alpha chain